MHSYQSRTNRCRRDRLGGHHIRLRNRGRALTRHQSSFAAVADRLCRRPVQLFSADHENENRDNVGIEFQYPDGWTVKRCTESSWEDCLIVKKWQSAVVKGPSSCPEALLLLVLLDNGVPYGSRTRVAAVKGRCPRPLDERDAYGELLEDHCKLFKLTYAFRWCQTHAC
jgi:hypothetical protein